MERNDIWEQIASRYDTDSRIDVANIIIQVVRSELKETKEKTALDYGCGTGLIGLGLTDQFKSILFVDPSAQMIDQVNRKIEFGQIERASTLCCDFLEQVPNELQVDYVILSQVLLHIKNSRSILAGLYDVLKKDGHLLVIDFDKNESIISDQVHNGFEQKELIKLLKEIGFSSASSRTFYHGKGIFMNKDASMFILNAAK